MNFFCKLFGHRANMALPWGIAEDGEFVFACKRCACAVNVDGIEVECDLVTMSGVWYVDDWEDPR